MQESRKGLHRFIRSVLIGTCTGLFAIGLASCSCSAPEVQTVTTKVKTGVNYAVPSEQSADIQDEVTQAMGKSADELFPDAEVDESSVTYTLSDCNEDGIPEILAFAQGSDGAETFLTVLAHEFLTEGSSAYHALSQPVPLAEVISVTSPEDIVVSADARGNSYLSSSAGEDLNKLHQIFLDSRELISKDEVGSTDVDDLVQVQQSPKDESNLVTQISDHVTEGEAPEVYSVQAAYQHFLDEFKSHANRSTLDGALAKYLNIKEAPSDFFTDVYSYSFANLNNDAIPEMLVRYSVEHEYTPEEIQSAQFIFVVSYDPKAKEVFIANQCASFTTPGNPRAIRDIYPSNHIFTRGMYFQDVYQDRLTRYLHNAIVYLDGRDLKQSTIIDAQYYPGLLQDYSNMMDNPPELKNPVGDDLQTMKWYELSVPVENVRLGVTSVKDAKSFEDNVAEYNYSQDSAQSILNPFKSTVELAPISEAITVEESNDLIQLAENAGLSIATGTVSQKQIEYTYYNYGVRPDEQRSTNATTLTLDGPLEVWCHVGNNAGHENLTINKLRLLQFDDGEVPGSFRPTLEKYDGMHVTVGVNAFDQNIYSSDLTGEPVAQYVMYLGSDDASS